MNTTEHHQLPAAYHDTFAEMLYDIGQAPRIKEQSLTSFWPLLGDAALASRGVMFVGRAVNGWGPAFTRQDIATHEGAEQQAAAAYGEAQKTETTWVTEYAGARLGADGKPLYNTNRSPYWACIREISRLVDPAFTDTAWPHALSWSNLYKVSPFDGGNPSTRLCKAQFRCGAKLLQMEIAEWHPSMVVVIAQEGWWNDFVTVLEIDVHGQASGAVEGTASKFGAHWIFTVRPERRNQARFVADVVGAMRSIT